MTDPERCRIAEATLITGLSKRTLQDLARRGCIPGAIKVAIGWEFEEDAIREWLADAEARKPAEAEARALGRSLPDRSYIGRLPIVRGLPDRIYFIQAHSGHIKIGLAYQPRSRLMELQVGHPLPLTLLATMRGGRAAEKHLHKFFNAERVRGEWFEPSERLMRFIGRLSK